MKRTDLPSQVPAPLSQRGGPQLGNLAWWRETWTNVQADLLRLRAIRRFPGTFYQVAAKNHSGGHPRVACSRTCGLIVESCAHHQITGMVETELFAPTYRSHGPATVRYPVLEMHSAVESLENGRGFSLRVLREEKPGQRPAAEV